MKNTLIALALLPFLAFSQTQKGVSPVEVGKGKESGSTYAVVVGISNYQDEEIPDLRFAHKDAEAFANFLRSRAGGALDEGHLILLTEEQATTAQFGVALDWLLEVAKEGDQAIIYFSGHGDLEQKTRRNLGFLLCWDSPSKAYMTGAFALYFLQNIIETISLENKAKVIVITDACHAGQLAGNDISGSSLANANLAKQYAREIKILSCQPNEYSIEGEQWGGGRGAFSFNLVEALYGMADSNNDLSVTLQEVGRYLEDHVTAEVAPVSQVPIVMGNRTERLAFVDIDLLAKLHSGKASQMAMLSPVEPRGMEDVLATVDTTVRKIYQLFKKSLKDKVFFSAPMGEAQEACAEAYYTRLIQEPKLKRLHSTMRRNYAAALQDDAQQELNFILKTSLTKEILTGKPASQLFKDYPAYLGRAAELLGTGHYLYADLQARKSFFEGKIYTKPEKKRQAFFQALKWQPDMPHALLELGYSYSEDPEKFAADSCIYYWNKASEMVPSWISPYICLAHYYLYQDFNKAVIFLNKANAIDSNSIILWYFNGINNAYQDLNSAAEQNFIKVINSSDQDIQFPGVHYKLGNVYYRTDRFEAAEQEYKNALQIDSTYYDCYYGLGKVYNKIHEYEKAEKAFKFLIKHYANERDTNMSSMLLDSFQLDLDNLPFVSPKLKLLIANYYLWKLYNNTGRTGEAEQLLTKILEMRNGPKLLRQIGKAFYLNGQYERSDYYFEAFLNLKDPLKSNGLRKALSYLGWFFLIHGDFDRSKQFMEESITKLNIGNGDFFNPYYDLAWLYYSSGQKQAAVRILDEIINGNGRDDIELNGHRIMFSAMMNPNDAAKAKFEDFVSVVPDIMDVWYCLLQIKNNELSQAEISYQSIMDALYPWWAKRYLRLSFVRLLIQNNRYEEAIDLMDNCRMDHYTFNYLLLSTDEAFTPLWGLDAYKALIKKYFPEKVN